MFLIVTYVLWMIWLTFFPRSCRCTRNCDTKSCSFTGLGSTIVTDFTPDRTRFLQISAPRPLIPTSKTHEALSLMGRKPTKMTKFTWKQGYNFNIILSCGCIFLHVQQFLDPSRVGYLRKYPKAYHNQSINHLYWPTNEIH